MIRIKVTGKPSVYYNFAMLRTEIYHTVSLSFVQEINKTMPAKWAKLCRGIVECVHGQVLVHSLYTYTHPFSQ